MFVDGNLARVDILVGGVVAKFFNEQSVVEFYARGSDFFLPNIGAAPERSLTGLRKLVAAQPATYAAVRTANFPILAAGGTFAAFGPPVINARGAVAFAAVATEAGAIQLWERRR